MTSKLARFPHATRFLGLALSACFVSVSLNAQTTPTATESIPRFAIGVEAGTVGFGPAVIVTASKHFTANVGYTWLSFDYDLEDDNGDYNGKLKLSNFQAIANWHPMAGSFHLSAGAFVSNNKVDVIAKPKPGVGIEINNHDYAPGQITSAGGTVELTKGAVPYVGLGWSKKPANKGFGFFMDMGILFMDSPKTKLTASGPAANLAIVQADLRADEKRVDKELNDFKYYPVIQVGVLYRF